MRNNWGVLARIVRDRRLRRVELGFAGFAIAEYGTWLAAVVYAYDLGGADEAGLFAIAMLAPAIVIAPLAAFAADRFASGRVLAIGYTIQSTAMALTALAMATDAGRLGVYPAAALASASVTLTRPALGVVLPNVTHRPADLAAANVVMGFVEYTGMFLGPGLAGLLISRGSVAVPFALGAVLTAGAALLMIGVPIEPHSVATPSRGGALGDTVQGLRALRSHRRVRTTIAMLSIGGVVTGAADVLFVLTADEVTGGDTARAGILGTAFGVGAVLGSSATVLLVGRARLTPAIAIAVGMLATGLMALATATTMALAIVLFTIMGAGESILRVAASTLIQRVSDIDVIGRFFGVAEGIRMFALAFGSGAIGVAATVLGYEEALLVSGATVLAVLLVRLGALFRIDRGAAVPDERILELVLGDDIFSALPSPIVERVVADVERCTVPAGHPVVVEGQPGDRYYLVDRGTAEVSIDGSFVRVIHPGGGFGELALLHDVPRTATVTATEELEVLTVEREPFLQAVTAHPRAAAICRERSVRYLGSAD